ncbi:hypothetical protein FE410_05435 [Leuconostoc carnosum]|uniref:DUF4429 domain-containing protein n=1 Tax=Leuconostoc carnosum TaxID=1252 RepID=UPI0012396236|nr:hypothetical protein [Leuconostoc carnosum]KAA8371133.1 hypothetical protein FE414_05430 [Leuconostoc carnosum]KAA8382774.1 hypothetical protein FE410_05435 [Leuconostoc carnosum]
MGLFSEKENVDLFASTTAETTFYIKSSKTTVRLDNKFVRIARGGVSNAILQGLDGEKSILLSSITAFQIKEPGLITGYMQLMHPGSSDIKAGESAIQDEYTIPFIKSEKSIVLSIKNALEEKLS